MALKCRSDGTCGARFTFLRHHEIVEIALQIDVDRFAFTHRIRDIADWLHDD